MAAMVQATSLRREVAGLAAAADRDLSAVWAQVAAGSVDFGELRDGLRDVLPGLVDAYGTAASALAAEWYDDTRLRAGVGGAFRAVPAALGSSGADALAVWGVSPLFQAEPNVSAARSLVAGGLQRRIVNFSRATVAGSSVADPRADGWQRQGVGECDFCALLIGRGAVYSERSADFASHDHCNCYALPAFKGAPRPVKPYTPSSRNITDAGRARVREYIRTH